MKYKALSVKQPWAEKIARLEKKIELRSQNTHYRGEIVICASAKRDRQSEYLPDIPHGCTVCLAEIYDCIPFSQLNEEQLKSVTVEMRDIETSVGSGIYKYNPNYAWFLRNVRRVVEIPMKGQLGIFNLDLGDMELTEYPKALTNMELNRILSKESKIKKKINWIAWVVAVLWLSFFGGVMYFTIRYLYHLIIKLII